MVEGPGYELCLLPSSPKCLIVCSKDRDEWKLRFFLHVQSPNGHQRQNIVNVKQTAKYKKFANSKTIKHKTATKKMHKKGCIQKIYSRNNQQNQCKGTFLHSHKIEAKSEILQLPYHEKQQVNNVKALFS